MDTRKKNEVSRTCMVLTTGEEGKRYRHMGESEEEGMWTYLQKEESWNVGGAFMGEHGHTNSLCVGTLNLHQFLCRTETLVHWDKD